MAARSANKTAPRKKATKRVTKKRAAKKSTKKAAPRKAAKKSATKVAKRTTKRAAKRTAKKPAKVAKRTTKRAAKRTAKKPAKAAKRTTKRAVKRTAKKPVKVAKRTTKRGAKKTSKPTPTKAPKRAGKTASRKAKPEATKPETQAVAPVAAAATPVESPVAAIIDDMPLPSLAKATTMIRLFGRVKIPLIGFCRPKVIELDQDKIVMAVPLNRRTKNHHGSMYFGALAIGADTAAGLAAMMTIDHERKANGHVVLFVFKDVQADFLRRPDGDVHFTSADTRAVRALVHKAIQSGEREEMPVSVVCTVPTVTGDEPVANFTLTISLKRR